MERNEFDRKIVRVTVREKLDMLKRCSYCRYNSVCWFIPEIHNCKDLLDIDSKICESCGWRKADPDPCETCEDGEFYTTVNHQYYNEI